MTDPLAPLRLATSARVALGRAGDALPTARLLELRAARAAARDAVHAPLQELDLPGALHVRSAAPDRATYLQRPDLGRRLADGTALPRGDHDVVFVVADGLSALAVQRHAVPVLRALREPPRRVGRRPRRGRDERPGGPRRRGRRRRSAPARWSSSSASARA